MRRRRCRLARVRREGGGAATCHLAKPIRAHFYASGEVRKVSWLTVEGDLVLVSTLHLQMLCWKMKGELADELESVYRHYSHDRLACLHQYHQ